MSCGNANQTDGGMVRYAKKLKSRNFRVTWLSVMNRLSFKVELRRIESFCSVSLDEAKHYVFRHSPSCI